MKDRSPAHGQAVRRDEPRKRERVNVAGMPFDLLTVDEVDRLITERPGSEGFRYVVTPNVDHVVRSARSGYRGLYEAAWISVCDSRILARLSPIIGIRFPEVVTGSDLTRRVFEQYLDQGEQVTVIGADEAAISKLAHLYPHLVLRHHNPPMGFIRNEADVLKAVDFVLSNPSRFVFLAVGSPQQELLAQRLARAGARGIGLCIGASILFIAGVEKRAPVWMQRMSLEWLFRLIQNPRRLWRRYLIENPFVFFLVLKSRFAKKGS